MSLKSLAQNASRTIGRGIDQRYESLVELASMMSLFAKANRAQNGIVETVIVTVVVGIVGLVGILIYSEVEGAIPLDIAGARTDPDNATDMELSAVSLSEGFGSAVELLPVVLIVLIASLVIIVIGGMRAR